MKNKKSQMSTTKPESPKLSKARPRPAQEELVDEPQTHLDKF
jgi:hypothetical protein